jgi:glycerophosphoryl diester phosphodiesterase
MGIAAVMFCVAKSMPPAGGVLTPLEIIAHRGASRERPENTIAAFARALELGADGVELDVHLRSDGVLIVHHDAVPSVPRDSIPTLQQVIDVVGAALTIYCELKGAGTAAPACALLGASPGRSAVHAFDHRQIAAARAINAMIPRGVLETSYHIDPLASLRSVDARDLWQEKELIDEALVHAVHAAGGRVIAWTVDTPNDIERLAALGIDGICTNDAATARRVLGR